MNSSRHSNDNLPPNFVKTIRTLFDILDTERSGYIRFADLAEKWSDNPPRVSGIPPGFLDCLKRVTPPNGMLTFERFCTGLRLALVEAKQMKKDQNSNYFKQPSLPANAGYGYSERVQSDPNLLENSGQSEGVLKRRSPPQMKNTSEDQRYTYSSQPAISAKNPPVYENYDNFESQKKLPSKLVHVVHRRYQPRAAASPPSAYSVSRRPASASDAFKVSPPGQKEASGRRQVAAPLAPAPGSSIRSGLYLAHPETLEARPTDSENATVVVPTTATENNVMVRWRNKSNLTVVSDQRRHTVSEGVVDSHLSKHEKILMEEKDIVQRGLDVADRLKDWYNERLSSLDTRQKYVSKGMVPVDYAVHEEKLNYLRAHVTEVNRRMTNLMESSEKGFPSYMNFQKQRDLPQPADDQILWVKKQNEALTDEVTEKTKRIQELERELASLRRQYVQHRTEVAAKHRSNSPALSSSRSSQSSPLANGHHPPPYHMTNGYGHPVNRLPRVSAQPFAKIMNYQQNHYPPQHTPTANDVLATLI